MLGTLAERADIFISYRRADTGMAAGRLRDELIEHFGSRRVFMDLHGIDPSADWRETIGAAIAACKVGVVLIGQGFMAADAQGRPRLYDEGDVLRFDAERLRILVERHHLYTGSARAREILENWDEALGSFVKVMPKDYRRALMDMAAERQAAAAVAAE